MIKITETINYEFEMPKHCGECPMRISDQCGNACIHSCKLLNDKDWTKNTINYRKSIYPSGYEFYKDAKCPLVDGSSLTISKNILK